LQTHPDILFWDVDTQVDFMHPNGALYVPRADEILPELARLTAAARDYGVPVVATADDHEAGDAEISDHPDLATTYPPHCMHGTRGQQKIDATRLAATTIGHRPLSDAEIRHRVATSGGAFLVLKKRFDAFTNPNAERLLAALAPRRVVVYGVALDVCNRAAVEGLWRRGYRDLAVVTDATRALDAERGRALLADWRRRGIDLVTTDAVLAEVAERRAVRLVERPAEHQPVAAAV